MSITRRDLIGSVSALPFVLPKFAHARNMCPILCGPTNGKQSTLLPANAVLVHSGDSITAFGDGFGSNFATTAINILGYSTWADCLCGNTLYKPPGANTGVPGRSAVSIASGWTAEVLKFNPKLVTLMAGTNDLGTVDNSGIIITALSTCLSLTLAAGSKMVLIPILPRAGANALNTAAEQGRVTANAWITAQAIPGKVAISGIAGYDPATMSQGDGLHPTTVGAEIIGRQVAASIATLETPFDVLSLVTSPLNLLGSAGLLTGTAGGKGGGVTGTVPTGWTQQDNTAAGVVGSLITNPNGGNWYQAVINGTTSTGQNGTQLTLNSTQTIKAGSYVTALFEVEVDVGSSNLMGFSSTLTFTGNTSNNQFTAPVTYPIPNKNIRSFVARTMPVFLTADATALSFVFGLLFATGTSLAIAATVRVGRVTLLVGAPFAASGSIPVNTVTPVVTGTAQVGQTLTASNGTWTNSPTSFSYQWYGNSQPISGATASTYTPYGGDVGTTIACLVYANNSSGNGSSLSASTSTVIAATTGFTYPGMLAQYRADLGTYVDAGVTLATNGQPVQQWNDQSPNAYHLRQTTAGKKPILSTGSLNGRATLTASGAAAMQAPIFLLGGSTVWAFMVAKETAGNSARILDFSVSGSELGATAFIAAFYSSLTAPAAYNNGVKSTGTIVSGSWNQIGSVFDGANNTLYIAGVAQTPVAAVTSFAANGALNAFVSATGGNNLTGAIAEIIIGKGTLASGDRATIVADLLSRWGV